MVENMDNFELAPPADVSHYFSGVTKQRQASSVKKFYKYFSIPGIANLAGGLPNAKYFPFDTLESSSALPQRFKPTPNNPVDPPSSTTSTSKHKNKDNAYLNDPTSTHVTVPHASKEPNLLKRIDLNTALQYGTAQGYPPLYLFVREFALTRLHPNIPYKDGAEVILTCGSTDGFAKTVECFSNTWSPDSGRPVTEREGLLCEEFAYMNALQTAKPRGMNLAPVAVDAEGMLAYGHPKCLYNVLDNWDASIGKRPHMLYTVTMGQNPTSGLLSMKRRKEIYSVCQEFDVLIVEDDPYFYIQFPHAANELSQKYENGKLASINHFAESNLNHQTSLAVPVKGKTTNCNGRSYTTTRMRRGKSSGSEFLDSLVPSYLSIDVDGRVIRLDTFSKTVAPGCRLGWITAQPEVVERILRITECSTQQPSGFVQSLVAELLIGPDHADAAKSMKSGGKSNVGWKIDGWIRWLEGLRGNYERRMRTMCEILNDGKFVALAASPMKEVERTNEIVRGIREGNLAMRRKRLDPIIACSHSRKRELEYKTPTTVAKDEADDFEMLSKTQIYDFVPPMAGMFLWLHLRLDTHPLFGSSKFTHTEFAHALWLFQTHKPYQVLLAPGDMFCSSEEIRTEKGWQYFRLCFAAVDETDIADISKRFVRGCHDFWEITDEQEILDLLDEDQEALDERMEDMMQEGTWTVSPLMC